MDQTVGISKVGLPADFGQWDDLLALIRRAFTYMDGVIDPPSSAHLLTADSLAEKAKKETGFLAVENGRFVGCVFALERARDFYVGKLAVEPELQGQGIGTLLMRAVEDLARERGKDAIELQTRIELTANHAAFARLGFREAGRTAHEGYDRPTSITMRKVLT
ncbi:GNAT family N-acetyltransferase [Mesorhizobium sp. M2D.F.Ca.ET.185.01.1.1]|uniref:GNAT family N-acetyltransferase n=1 Tax=unclassified Mesorhizobium TaxID=325217 RepID=UPI000FCB9793|nr:MULTISPECIES: GNAT family N-acetyltransferase [unclassified Mesorhizobium]TGP78030.1 GNAT family N-acetyltransferase [bacterium M00.F.Ca.ET.227.01.1.1]TGP88152.1 GNAT family N-acetyltransferase [bacterium M00.F.Ca.ET.221.01.1.1]TGP93367.1 GNAT family N-acetyltransferase [bacterium M00.F.Ca.ET.222.01.1.1]TGU13063.1 GNAT family N-acetyltransferase [bacterium M00.F.Ca.ET.163.01.1.1]TGU31546.1 GNAT family N-acetyltransferase [bacterium M00.F.Ca.ET.156.01.1.1]TGU45342.1 GNAT family N-acetyltran